LSKKQKKTEKSQNILQKKICHSFVLIETITIKRLEMLTYLQL